MPLEDSTVPLEESPHTKSTQITLKVPTEFLTDFDSITNQLGYPRNEAIREAMRRFVDWGHQKVNERHPERAMGLAQGIFGNIFGGLMNDVKKLEQESALPEKPGQNSTRQPKKPG